MTGELQSTAAMTLMYAKAYGIYFIVTGLALMVNPNRFRSWYNDSMGESRRALVGGLIALVIGCFIIATHNHIVADWPIIITLIGYWGVIAGGGSMISDRVVHLFKPMINSSDLVYRASGVAWLVVGLFLANQGFGG